MGRSELEQSEKRGEMEKEIEKKIGEWSIMDHSTCNAIYGRLTWKCDVDWNFNSCLSRKEIWKVFQKRASDIILMQPAGWLEHDGMVPAPYAKMFSIYANNITFMWSNDGYHQVLLDKVIEKEKKFVFNMQITHTANGCLIIGVVDTQTQRQQQYSHNSGHAVYGYIYYGKNGTYSYTSTGIILETGMEVEVEVNLQKGTVKFMRKGTWEWKHRR